MSDLKSLLKTAGLIGSFGQIMGTGKAVEIGAQFVQYVLPVLLLVKHHVQQCV